MGEQLARTYGVGLAPRTRILPPRVDISGFSRGSRRRTAGDPLRLVMVGAVNENKGQLRLIRALSDIAFPVELHVVGEGPDLPGVNREADDRRREGSSLRIVAHGALPHAGVADVLRSCDLFIMYSRTEATPRAMMEAMAVGLPIITTDVGFCADVVQHGIEGFVLGPDPDHEIIGVLDRLHSDPALAGQLGAAARARAELHFESVRLFEEYRQLIAETAGR
jgi:glycosyltransferase involved in cell wall biosynthesis